MEWLKIISLILGSGVVSSFVTSFINKIQNDKNIKIENITKERKAWRDKIRDLTKEINIKFYKNEFLEIKFLISDFETRLNPTDEEDKQIIELLYSITRLNKDNDESKIKEFNKRIALLLKHDWERVKKEIHPLPFKKIKRIKYDKMLIKKIEV